MSILFLTLRWGGEITYKLYSSTAVEIFSMVEVT